MAELLHEYWADENGGMFGPVNEHNDVVRPHMMRNAKLVHSFMASSFLEARRISHEMLGEEFWPTEHDEEGHYTEDQKAEQDAYLLRRKL